MIHMLYTFETNVLWKKRTILKVNESSSNHQFSGGYVRWFISFNFNVHLLSTTWPFSVALSRCQEEMEGRAPKRHLSARHRPVRWQNAFQYNFETEALRVWPGWFAWKKCWKMKKISGFFSCLICWRMFIRKSTHYILMDSVCVFLFQQTKKDRSYLSPKNTGGNLQCWVGSSHFIHVSWHAAFLELPPLRNKVQPSFKMDGWNWWLNQLPTIFNFVNIKI